ncbi:hypothetical protein GCM10029978_063690 [Actinoallomurus acanthiterrae]
MEFLVHIEINWPPGVAEDERERLYAAELERGHELARLGLMKRLWRIPGRWANWGLWEAPDADELHTALTSLPLWPWMSVDVHPTAVHPNDPPRQVTASDDGALGRIGRVGAWTGALGRAPASVARRAVAEIERLGYGSVWIAESDVGKEVFSNAGLLLASTRRIVVATGIANIWVRDSTAMNAATVTLGEAYPGRFLLGLGVSHKPQVAPRGHEYGRPVATMRGYLDAMDGIRSQAPLPEPAVPRVLAALRPKMLELARERAAGAHPYFVPPEHTAQARTILGDRPLLAPEQAVVLETDPSRARELARQHMAWYLTMPNYINNLRALGFDDDDITDGGSDRLVDTIVAWGDEGAILARVREHLDAGADHVAVQPIVPERGIGVDVLRLLAPALCSL